MLISYWYNQAYFEIVAIQNGDFIPHSEFYPKQFQDNIKDGCVEFYGGPDSYVNLEFDSQTLTINYTFILTWDRLKNMDKQFLNIKG